MSKSRLDLSLPVEPDRFAPLLLSWYDREKRDLPWRQSRDPYKVWLSEVMLQQTRVTTVIPYYERFLRRYPRLEDLAAADAAQVLDLWAGLGYYRRARNLLKAARIVQTDLEGRFPDNISEAMKLPGIGRYSAGAILSIAFGRPYPVVDGNVRRVMARFLAFDETIGSTFTRALWQLLGRVVRNKQVENRVADFNQALMELGALVCRVRDPGCPECPLQNACLARKAGSQDELPRLPRKDRRVEMDFTSAVIQDGDQFLMSKSEGEPFLEGFWEFPKVLGHGCFETGYQAFREIHRLELRFLERLKPVVHQITFRRLVFYPYRAELTGALPAGSSLRWLAIGERGYPMSAYVRKIEHRL